MVHMLWLSPRILWLKAWVQVQGGTVLRHWLSGSESPRACGCELLLSTSKARLLQGGCREAVSADVLLQLLG